MGTGGTGPVGETSAGGAGGVVGGAGGGESGGSSAGLTPLFAAQGHLGRTLVSCDYGRTWVHDQSSLDTYRGSEPSTLRCFEENEEPGVGPYDLDCDHQAYPGRGLVFGNGKVFATFGWGAPGAIRASDDGAAWSALLSDTTFGGLAYVQGALVAGARQARRSVGGGSTFSDAVDTGMSGWNVRRVGQTHTHGERVILVGEGGDAVISSDGGVNWWKPDTFPSGCGANIQTEGGIAASDDVWLVVGGDGGACRSTDGGETWTAGDVGSSVSSHLVFDGEAFLVWSHGTRHRSVDGVTWTEAATSPASLNLGVVAASNDGHLVAGNGGWAEWYEDQVLYYSDDGITWTEAETYVGSHPLRDMEFGWVKGLEACQ